MNGRYYKITYKKPMKCPLCEGVGVLNEPPLWVREIIKLRLKGLTYKQIGKAIGCAPNTAHYHYKRWEIRNKERK